MRVHTLVASSCAQFVCGWAQDKFFKCKDGTYNPQFRYYWSSEGWPSSVKPQCIDNFSSPSTQHMTNALRILQNTIDKYGSYNEYEERYGGKLLDREGCRRVVQEYFRRNNVTQMHLRLNPQLSSRGAFALSKHGPTLYLNPEGCREAWLEGTLDHEVRTQRSTCSSNLIYSFIYEYIRFTFHLFIGYYLRLGRIT